MSRLRHFTTTFAVLSLLVAVPALIAAPLSAQDDDEDEPARPTTVFSFTNVMENPDADNDGEPDRLWQVQVIVSALGDCVPQRGAVGYTSPWVDAGEQVGTTLSLTECVFRFSARVRVAEQSECLYAAQLGWVDSAGDLVGSYHDESVISSSRPDGASRLNIRLNPGRGCIRPYRTYFTLGGDDMVEDLAGAPAGADLVARARRAAAVGEYMVRVESETSATGCDIGTTFTLHGDGATSRYELGATGDACPVRASIVAAPAHVKVPRGRSVRFDAALPNIIIDLTPLVRIESSRIAIIQDVSGSLNQGAVSYAIDRSCGGVPVASPAAQAASSELFEGRFTVHSPDIPQFGPVATYPAVAASTTSTTVVGCAVTVTVGNVPAGCVVDGGNSRTLAWSAANPFDHFDFEFDIYCGDSVPPAPAGPAVGDEMTPTENGAPAQDMVPADTGAGDGGTTVGDGGGAADMQSPADPAGPPRDAPTG